MICSRDPKYLIRELNKTNLIIKQTKKAIKASPDDVALQMVLRQEEREVVKLVVQLYRFAKKKKSYKQND